jgi:hypothetical protein
MHLNLEDTLLVIPSTIILLINLLLFPPLSTHGHWPSSIYPHTTHISLFSSVHCILAYPQGTALSVAIFSFYLKHKSFIYSNAVTAETKYQ